MAGCGKRPLGVVPDAGLLSGLLCDMNFYPFSTRKVFLYFNHTSTIPYADQEEQVGEFFVL
jgi:hypothetical protein